MIQHKTKGVDWNSFVHQPDTQVNSAFADATKDGLNVVKRNFERYSPSTLTHQIINIKYYTEAYQRLPLLVSSSPSS